MAASKKQKEWYKIWSQTDIGKEKRKEYSLKWKSNNKEKYLQSSRNSNLKFNYGIDSTEYDKLLLAQNYVCAICKKPPQGKRPLHVDHNHTTGVVRGLLCILCNTALGKFREDIQTLENAILYLNRKYD